MICSHYFIGSLDSFPHSIFPNILEIRAVLIIFVTPLFPIREVVTKSLTLSFVLQILASVNLAEEKKIPKLSAETTWNFEM